MFLSLGLKQDVMAGGRRKRGLIASQQFGSREKGKCHGPGRVCKWTPSSDLLLLERVHLLKPPPPSKAVLWIVNWWSSVQHMSLLGKLYVWAISDTEVPQLWSCIISYVLFPSLRKGQMRDCACKVINWGMIILFKRIFSPWRSLWHLG